MTGSGQRFPQGYTLRGCFVHTQGVLRLRSTGLEDSCKE